MDWLKFLFVEVGISFLTINVVYCGVGTDSWFTKVAITWYGWLIKFERFIEGTAREIKQEWIFSILIDWAQSLEGFGCIGEYFECIRMDNFYLNSALIKWINARYKSLDVKIPVYTVYALLSEGILMMIIDHEICW